MCEETGVPAMGCEEAVGAPNARQVVERHRDRLMSLPGVGGVGVGTDPTTGSEAVVVYVVRRIPREQLADRDLIPRELDTVRVRVMEIGSVVAQNEPIPQNEPPG